MIKFRKPSCSIRSLCAYVITQEIQPKVLLLDIIGSWMGRKLSDQELNDIVSTFKEEDRAEARTKLLRFRELYLWLDQTPSRKQERLKFPLP